jgi:hypothetical protein
MPRKTLTTLANPPREFNLREQTITWLPLTLRDLAEIEAKHGSIADFFTRAVQGHITPILEILTTAIRKANPAIDPEQIAEMFSAGDILSGQAPAAQLLQEILTESGLVAEQIEKKE